MDRRKEVNLILDIVAFLIGSSLITAGVVTYINGVTQSITIPAFVLGGILFVGALVAFVIDWKKEKKDQLETTEEKTLE
ncbi:MAG: hypothetical protein FK733_11155 [Asgard group archaeon]|nr:hypothetical protein [Asgard group archaeon]